MGEHYKNHWRGYVRRAMQAGVISIVEVAAVDEPMKGQMSIDD